MIINDTHRFAFIHIPKCAGSTIRQYFKAYDETPDYIFSRRDNCAGLGFIDYAHIPLFVLRDHFASDYQKVEDYKSFAIVRDPYKRFASSVSQHLKRFGERPLQGLSGNGAEREVLKIIDQLSTWSVAQTYLPYQFIHFQRQIDFIEDNNRRCVDSIYTMDNIENAVQNIARHLNLSLCVSAAHDVSKTNAALIYKNALFRTFGEALRPLLKHRLQPRYRKRMKYIVNKFACVPRDGNLESIFRSPRVTEFVSWYYADDIQLYRNQSTKEAEV